MQVGPAIEQKPDHRGPSWQPCEAPSPLSYAPGRRRRAEGASMSAPRSRSARAAHKFPQATA
eukprot:3936244-Rhodomonas_salina.1